MEAPETYFIAKLDAFLKEIQKEIIETDAKVGIVAACVEDLNDESHAALVAIAGYKSYQDRAIILLLKKDKMNDL